MRAIIESFSRDQVRVMHFPEGVSSLSAKADYLARQHNVEDARTFRKLADGYYEMLVQLMNEEGKARNE